MKINLKVFWQSMCFCYIQKSNIFQIHNDNKNEKTYLFSYLNFK